MIIWILIAFMPAVLAGKQVCPGGSMQCSDTETCCELLDKSYGCCPLKNAICCDDHIHCCPSATKCSAGLCIQNDGNLNRSVESNFVRNNDIICPGGKYSCPDNNTCCKGIDPSIYNCCPVGYAVCCTDGIHCCPENTVCDLSAKKCKGKGFVFEMYSSKKDSLIPNLLDYIPINLNSNNLTNIICPGSSFQCPNEYTCCKLPTGDWGCCPYENGVCCNDHLHCCPSNMKCDSTSTSCIQGLLNTTAIRNKPAEPMPDNILCPDKTYCSDEMTCCSLKNKHYGCCPYQNAVCCPDQQHCCPNGFQCDEVKKQCVPKHKWLFSFLKYFNSF